jgi:hypothetical protein
LNISGEWRGGYCFLERALEYGPDRYTVTAVSPNVVDTRIIVLLLSVRLPFGGAQPFGNRTPPLLGLAIPPHQKKNGSEGAVLPCQWRQRSPREYVGRRRTEHSYRTHARASRQYQCRSGRLVSNLKSVSSRLPIAPPPLVLSPINSVCYQRVSSQRIFPSFLPSDRAQR